ncbi:MAG: hypothetical protein GY944_25465 [bacterium]|nr:hypothetical protein [bacterium]MCP5044393.1 hypothetical protein [bacterium]
MTFLRTCVAFLVIGSPLCAAPAFADEVKRKITTIVAGPLPSGGSKIEKQVIEECVLSLPNESDLAPVVDAKSKYMRSVNGDAEVNGSVRTYSATVVVPALIQQKQLVIVATSSVEKTEPVLQEVVGRFDRSISFTSNSENGDHFGGRDLVKEYYFSNEKLAIEDAMKRARAWLKQQRSVMCND